MRVARSREPSLCFGNVDAISQNIHLLPPLAFVLEPGVRHTEIEVDQWMDWWVTPKEDFPVVVDIFLNRCKADTEHGQVFECLLVLAGLYFLSLGVVDDLSGNVDLVGHVGDIKVEVVDEIRKVDFFVRVQTKPAVRQPPTLR